MKDALQVLKEINKQSCEICALEADLSDLRDNIRRIERVAELILIERDEYAKLIESMKCCGNCKQWRSQTYTCVSTFYKSEPTDKCDDWEQRK